MSNSKDFWDLAETRLEDAEGLIAIKRWSCAYYIAGYAVECALKALIIRETERTGSIFDDRKSAAQFLEGFFVHELEQLLKSTGLEADFGLARSANPALNDNWFVVKDWKETTRYNHKDQSQAERLVDAINHSTDGVMKWIRDRW